MKYQEQGDKTLKIMIASDIHGSAYCCRRMLEAFRREQADRLVLLGDILYHGPRNDLPQEYMPREVAAMLNSAAPSILCVRGNCDAEVDQMILAFPMMADYAVIASGSRVLYATHGHMFHEEHVPPLHPGDILMSGHTHVPKWSEREGLLFVNPGSVSLPKEESDRSYMVFSEAGFVWKLLDNGEEFMRKLL
jgi:putative phosphoesterase